MIIGITHFTSQMAAAAILDGWRKDLIRGDRLGGERMGPREVKVRLYSRSGTNDPREQMIAEYPTDTTKERYPKEEAAKYRNTFPDDVFMWCGSKPQIGEKGEATNRLEMWRAYGDDGRGVALTTWWNAEQVKNEKLDIIEVEYVSDSEFKDIAKKMEGLLGEQGDGGKNRSEREKIRKKRMNLGASHKHQDYEAEKEIRLVLFLGDESGAVRKSGRDEIHLEAPSGRLRTYIERPVRLGTTLTKLDITLGPRMMPDDARHWERMGHWMLAQMGLSGGRVQQSELQYIG